MHCEQQLAGGRGVSALKRHHGSSVAHACLDTLVATGRAALAQTRAALRTGRCHRTLEASRRLRRHGRETLARLVDDVAVGITHAHARLSRLTVDCIEALREHRCVGAIDLAVGQNLRGGWWLQLSAGSCGQRLNCWLAGRTGLLASWIGLLASLARRCRLLLAARRRGRGCLATATDALETGIAGGANRATLTTEHARRAASRRGAGRVGADRGERDRPRQGQRRKRWRAYA